MIAGVFAGFAAGVKLTAAPMLILAMPIALVSARRNFAAVKGAMVFVLAAMLTLSPWLIRNAVWEKNPVFPLALDVFGPGHFNAEQVARFEAAHTAPKSQQSFSQRLSAFVRQVPADAHFGYVLLPLAIACAAMRWRDRDVWLLVILLVQMLIVWLFFTHLIGRFFILAIPAAVFLVARIDWNMWAAVALSFITVGVSIFLIDADLRPFIPIAREGAFYTKNLSFMVSEELEVAEKAGDTIVLVGDSQAFLHQIPMKQLRYRTVFDLADGDWLTAWTQGTPPDAVLLVHPPELERLSKTYLDVKPMPQDLAAGHERAFIMPWTAVGR